MCRNKDGFISLASLPSAQSTMERFLCTPRVESCRMLISNSGQILPCLPQLYKCSIVSFNHIPLPISLLHCNKTNTSWGQGWQEVLTWLCWVGGDGHWLETCAAAASRHLTQAVSCRHADTRDAASHNFTSTCPDWVRIGPTKWKWPARDLPPSCGIFHTFLRVPW